MSIEIPRSSLIDELTEKQYQRFLKSLSVSCHDVLQTGVDEAYTIGFLAGQQAEEEQARIQHIEANENSPTQITLHF